MYEKVNPSHPDKVADRIAGAIVDLAYKQQENPKIAVEVLIGHGECNIIAETSVHIEEKDVREIVYRIANANIPKINYTEVEQDVELAKNQKDKLRCGDNGIFKGMPITNEQQEMAKIAKEIYEKHPTDGKYIFNEREKRIIICQSHAMGEVAQLIVPYIKAGKIIYIQINPLGEWTGGVNVDSGATNRKLGSDMGDAVTGGGINGKDLSKADVSVNIYAHLKAQFLNEPVELYCAIGDEGIDGKPYEEIVRIAKEYIDEIGGFEKLAEWGLIR